MDSLKKKGKKLALGTVYNILSKLKRLDFIESWRSYFAQYRFKHIIHENHPIGVISRDIRTKPRWFKLDFFDYLATLNNEDVMRVHDIHL